MRLTGRARGLLAHCREIGDVDDSSRWAAGKGASVLSESTTLVVASSSRQRLALRLGLWAGIVGPVFFLLVVLLDGWLTPGYSAMTEVISFLELGPTGWIQSLNFVLTGLLFILFAAGFFQWMRLRSSARSSSWWLYATAVLIALSGVGMIIAGAILPEAPGATQVTVRYILHTIAFSVIFLSLGLACLFVGSKFIRTPGWRIHGVYSLLASLFPIFAALGNLYSSFVVENASSALVSATTSQPANGGLVNRIIVAVAFAWYVILASRLLQQTRG